MSAGVACGNGQDLVQWRQKKEEVTDMLDDNIKTLRQAKGLSQAELARRLHVVRQTVSKWERGGSLR